MGKYGFVYIWYDRKHKRYYIGCHWGTEDDGYICSSVWMRNSYKRRPKDFGKRKILKRVYSNYSELLQEEYKWLSLIKDEELGKRYYNLSKKYCGHWIEDKNKRLTIAEKISKALTGKPTGRKGIKRPPEIGEKIRAALTGKKQSQETIEKRRIKLIGKTHSEETRVKISEGRKGQAPTKGRQKKSHKNGYRGVYNKGKKFEAQIRVDKKTISLGTYSIPEEAAMAYNKKALEVYGNNAILNFINI